MRILHGMTEVAGQGINTVKGLRENGIDATMAVWTANHFADSPDIDLKICKGKKIRYPFYAIRMGIFALKALKRFDVFHMHFGYFLTPYNFECGLSRLLKKRTFAEFHGTDIRFVFNQSIEYPYYQNNVPSKKYIQKSQKKYKRLLKNVTGVILHDYELDEHLPLAFDKNKIIHVPLRVNIDSITPAYPKTKSTEAPIIVHAPSSRSTKGTEEIIKILNDIKLPYQLILVEGKNHDEAMEIYKKADIIIDQISVGTYGVFSIEAMAMGKPVITFISEKMRALLPQDLPIISADFDSLKETVENLITDPELRNKIGLKSRQYVERYHDYKKVTKLLEAVYEGTNCERDLFKLL